MNEPQLPLRTRYVVLFAVSAWALMVRIPRFIVRWDEVAIAYAAYLAPTGQLVSEGRLGDAVSTWVGLHPPLYAILVALADLVWPAPAMWMGLSLACSVAAVAVVTWYKGVFAGLALASSTIHALDAAEVNNYSLASLGIAMVVAFPREYTPWRIFAAGLACWGHVLAAVVAGVVTLHSVFDGRQAERRTLLLGSTLAALPVVVGTLRLMGADSTYEQPAIDWSSWGTMVAEHIGPFSIPLVFVGVLGFWKAPGRAGYALLALGGAYLVALYLGVAAPHQRPYLGLFAPLSAVLVGRGMGLILGMRRSFFFPGLGIFVSACVLRTVGLVGTDTSIVQSIAEDLRSARGVDWVLDTARPADTIWLVSPALREDDDKFDSSPVLWRFPPFQAMRRVDVGGVPTDPTDWLYGHPRLVGSFVLHSSTELELARFDEVCNAAFQNDASVWVVLYDHLPAVGLEERIERAVRPYSVRHRAFQRPSNLGADQVWQIVGAPDRVQKGVGAHAR